MLTRSPRIGPFVLTVEEMVFDVLKWLAIFFPFVLGFAAALFVLFTRSSSETLAGECPILVISEGGSTSLAHSVSMFGEVMIQLFAIALGR